MQCCSSGGMAIAGAGAGVNELTALAVTSELAPTRKRGKYVAILVFTIVPFCPSVLWAQLIASHSNWRNCGAFCGAWAAIGLIMTLVFYHPPPRPNSRGLSKGQILKQIDVVGGLLSISGMVLFLMGLQWGGYQVSPALSISTGSFSLPNVSDKVFCSIPGNLPTFSSHFSLELPSLPLLSFGKRNSPHTLCSLPA